LAEQDTFFNDIDTGALSLANSGEAKENLLSEMDESPLVDKFPELFVCDHSDS
jgi:hypothetical protein